MTSPAQPQSIDSATPSASQYRSAYNGVENRGGKFSHFKCIPDQSHLNNGYWYIGSAQDELRAFQRGYNKPEDILIAVDSGERDNFSDIDLVWVPGRVDKILKSQISGTATQHIRAIYDMRRFLGKSLSFRGNVPTYPFDPRLDQYWSSRRIPATFLLDPILPATTKPPPSPAQSVGLSSPVVESNAGQDQYLNGGLQAQEGHRHVSSSLGRNTTVDPRTGSAVHSPRMTGDLSSNQKGATPAAKVVFPPTSAQAAPNSTAQTLQVNNHTTPIDLEPQPRRSPGPAKALPHSNSAQQPHFAGNAYPQGAFIQENPQLREVPARHRPPPLNVQALNSYPAVPPQELRNQTVSTPAHQSAQLANGPRYSNAAKTTYLSPYVVQRPYEISPGHSTPFPHSSYGGHHSYSMPVSDNAQRHSASRATSVVRHQTSGAVNILHAQSASTISNSVSRPEQLPTSLIDSRSLTWDQNASSTSAASQGPPTYSLDDDDSITVIPDEAIVSTSVVTPMRISSAQAQITTLSGPEGEQNRRPESLARPRDTDSSIEVSSPENSKTDLHCYDTSSAAPGPDLSSSATSQMYYGVPCMDCGEDEGHKPGCHLDIAPMTNLTILDHRALADSVRRFDPGPWTTHQGPPPEAEQEDAETQIRGMADVIRNEDTYKNDADLHLLPDDLMILGWAMKTAPNVEVICE